MRDLDWNSLILLQGKDAVRAAAEGGLSNARDPEGFGRVGADGAPVGDDHFRGFRFSRMSRIRASTTRGSEAIPESGLTAQQALARTRTLSPSWMTDFIPPTASTACLSMP